jgi:hypothetical protein
LCYPFKVFMEHNTATITQKRREKQVNREQMPGQPHYKKG